MDISSFDVVKFFHIAGVVLGMGAAVFMHLQFVRPGLTMGQLRPFLNFASAVIWTGLGIAIVSGIIFWIMIPSPRPDIFFVKLGFVAMLIIDGAVINRIGRPLLDALPPEQQVRQLPSRVRRIMYASGAFSVLGWWGAFAIGIL